MEASSSTFGLPFCCSGAWSAINSCAAIIVKICVVSATSRPVRLGCAIFSAGTSGLGSTSSISVETVCDTDMDINSSRPGTPFCSPGFLSSANVSTFAIVVTSIVCATSLPIMLGCASLSTGTSGAGNVPSAS